MTTMFVFRIQGKQEVIDVYSEETEVYKDKNYQQKQKVGRSLCLFDTAAMYTYSCMSYSYYIKAVKKVYIHINVLI